jgi:hypothetical protein
MLNPQIEKALAEFGDANDRRMADANTANEPREPREPREPLFHYTKEDALLSIVDSDEFWFTSIYQMDDAEELTFGFNVSRSLLQKAIAVKGGLVRAFCQDLLRIIDSNKIKELIAFYSISFGLRDDLQQWSCYGDGGRGVALGLAPDSSRAFQGSGSPKALA